MTRFEKTRADPRAAASRALADAAQRMPRLGPIEPDAAGLSPADRRLAAAIVRAGVQRWLTIEAVLGHAAGRPIAGLEPRLRGVLNAAAAQVLFLDRVPDHAAVDRGVELARRLVRPGAAKLSNAVLRNLTRLVTARRDAESPPSRDVVPLLDRGVELGEGVLPDPRDARAYLSVAWSVPRRLVDRWFTGHGAAAAQAMCRCAARTPPVIVDVGDAGVAGEPSLTPHELPGFAYFDPESVAAAPLAELLDRHRAWRVQDPTAADAVGLLGGVSGVARVLDYCAGRGTKTRQLAAMFPEARVTATDTSEPRRRDLRRAFADVDRVDVVEPAAALDGVYDVVVLDVPCSNTGVLARRPEARYRFSPGDLAELTAMQAAILETAAMSLAPGGSLLYSTCSVEGEENDGVVDAFAARRGYARVARRGTLPAGETPRTYRDGGYAATLCRR